MHEEKKVAVRKSNANELRDHNCIYCFISGSMISPFLCHFESLQQARASLSSLGYFYR